MDYGDVLTRAWGITWKNKGLWILGILAGCSGSANNPSQNFSYQTSRGEFPMLDRYFENLPPETLWLIIAGLICLTLIVVAIFLVLGTLGQTGLIAGVNHADEQGAVTLSQAWNLGLPHFWRMLGMTLLVGVTVLILAFLVAVVFVFGTVLTLGIGLACLIPLACLLVPLAIFVAMYLKFVQNSIVVEKRAIFDSFVRAWQLVQANLGPVIVMGIILLLIGAIGGFIVALPLIVVAVPALLALSAGDAGQGYLVAAVICGLVYLPVLLAASGLLQTFVNSAWTLSYRRLAGLGSTAVAVPSPS